MKTRVRKIRFQSGANAEATLAAVRAYSENACTAPIKPVWLGLKSSIVNRQS